MFVYIAKIKLESGAYVTIDITARNFSDACDKVADRDLVGMTRLGYKVICHD